MTRPSAAGGGAALRGGRLLFDLVFVSCGLAVFAAAAAVGAEQAGADDVSPGPPLHGTGGQGSDGWRHDGASVGSSGGLIDVRGRLVVEDADGPAAAMAPGGAMQSATAVAVCGAAYANGFPAVVVASRGRLFVDDVVVGRVADVGSAPIGPNDRADDDACPIELQVYPWWAARFLAAEGRANDRRLAYSRATDSVMLPLLWPNAEVAIEVGGDLAYDEWPVMATALADAMYHIELNTPVRFRARTADDASYLRTEVDLDYTLGVACSATAGEAAGEHLVIVSQRNCLGTSWVHEIGHVLGLDHEHQRPDRDDYIEVDDSIGSQGVIIATGCGGAGGYPDSFCDDSLSEYDYRSVMHYAGFAGELAPLPAPFAAYEDAHPDAVALPHGRGHMSNQAGLSPIDAAHLTALYGACIDDRRALDGCPSLTLSFPAMSGAGTDVSGTYVLGAAVGGRSHWSRSAALVTWHLFSDGGRWTVAQDTQGDSIWAYIVTPSGELTRPPSATEAFPWLVWRGGAWVEDDAATVSCAADEAAWAVGAWGPCREGQGGATRQRHVWCKVGPTCAADAACVGEGPPPDSTEACAVADHTDPCDFDTRCEWLHGKAVPSMREWYPEDLSDPDEEHHEALTGARPPPTDGSGDGEGAYLYGHLIVDSPPDAYRTVVSTEPLDLTSGDAVACFDYYLDGNRDWHRSAQCAATNHSRAGAFSVEASNGGDATVTHVFTLPGTAWRSVAVRLPALPGASRVHFALAFRGASRGGVAIDNVWIAPSLSACGNPVAEAEVSVDESCDGFVDSGDGSGDDVGGGDDAAGLPVFVWVAVAVAVVALLVAVAQRRQLATWGSERCCHARGATAASDKGLVVPASAAQGAAAAEP